MDPTDLFYFQLSEDFFDSKPMRIIEGMPRGKEYQLLYIKLLLISLKYGGYAMVSDNVQCTESDLSRLTNTEPKVLKDAIEVFMTYGLVKQAENGTYFFCEVPRLTQRRSNTPGAIRKRKFDARRKEQALQDVTQSVSKCNDSIEYRVQNNIRRKESATTIYNDKSDIEQYACNMIPGIDHNTVKQIIDYKKMMKPELIRMAIINVSKNGGTGTDVLSLLSDYKAKGVKDFSATI